MWFKVMRGEKLQHQLRDRYYVTRLPGPPKPLENTLEQNQQQEQMFFNQHPWSSLPISIRDCLGIPALILTLSQKLSQLIHNMEVKWICLYHKYFINH